MSNPTPLPRITHVAILFAGKVHSLPAPNRHSDVIRAIARENGVGIKGPDTQGFLDDKGGFLKREAAFLLAQENGQLRRREGSQYYQGAKLFSEDLW